MLVLPLNEALFHVKQGYIRPQVLQQSRFQPIGKHLRTGLLYGLQQVLQIPFIQFRLQIIQQQDRPLIQFIRQIAYGCQYQFIGHEFLLSTRQPFPGILIIDAQTQIHAMWPALGMALLQIPRQATLQTCL